MDSTNVLEEKVLTSALILASKMWENGELNVPKPPCQHELKQCQKYLMGMKQADMDDGQVQKALSMLILNNIGRHFNIVANHRYWVRRSYELAKASGILKHAEELKHRIDVHDLHKYGPQEALGYSIMFGVHGKFRKLEGEDKRQWQMSLEHHLKNNSHHPEYHNGDPMPEVDIEESLIDMFGCRLERDLKPIYLSLTPGKIMDLPSLYLKRYKALEDKIRIKSYIYDWKESLKIILGNNNEKGKNPKLKEWEEETGLWLTK
jgi:hypothetical protein